MFVSPLGVVGSTASVPSLVTTFSGGRQEWYVVLNHLASEARNRLLYG